MKTASIPVYGDIAVYIKNCIVCLKIDYTLRCLEYILFSIFTIKMLTNVIFTITY